MPNIIRSKQTNIAALAGDWADGVNDRFADVFVRAKTLAREAKLPDTMPMSTTIMARSMQPLDGIPDTSDWHNIDQSHASEMCTAYMWRMYRKVYRFDDDLYSALVDDTDSLTTIPAKAILSMPYPSIFVAINDSPTFAGLFANLTIDDDDPMLVLTPLAKHGTTHPCTSILLQDCTIDLAFDRMQGKMLADQRYIDIFGVDILQKMIAQERRNFRALSRYMPLILYLCSQDADILRRTKRGYVPPKTKADGEAPAKSKDTQVWDVGVRIGAAIRLYDAQDSAAPNAPAPDTAHHASARPHMRKAHWHHFWVGKKSDPANRKLVLKWLPPIAVNYNPDEAWIPTVVHNVATK